MGKHARAGTLAKSEDLISVPALMASYYVREPNIRQSQQRVKFGTSGHRGCAFDSSFNESHILAMSQAICAYREERGITGPLMLGKDTHALSEAAFITALEVFIANGVEVHVQDDFGFTPTPVISFHILRHNRENPENIADGVVITPSHNPPKDGGFKYNPPHGGPAGSDVTKVIEKYANAILSSELVGVNVVAYEKALKSPLCKPQPWISNYVRALPEVVNMKAIQDAGLNLGIDAMGGSGAAYWRTIKEQYGLNMDILNEHTDPTFSFMALDKDGAIRMDCSSADAMAGLLSLKDSFDIGAGNDPDYDRHGIVTPDGLMNPNHFLAVAIDYLCKNRSWSDNGRVGKTLVSSAIIDRVVEGNQRVLNEVPVGFKWFAEDMHQSRVVFAGEESAGASFLDMQGQPWSTDKDGLIMVLLAFEIQAVTGKSPAQYYDELEQQYGQSHYSRVDTKATEEQMQAFSRLERQPPQLSELAGESVLAVLTKAPGNGEAFGGLKIVTENGWFAARPSGTEPVYKVYAESLKSADHLAAIHSEAAAILDKALS